MGCGAAAENGVVPVPRKEEKHGPRPAGPLGVGLDDL